MQEQDLLEFKYGIRKKDFLRAVQEGVAMNLKVVLDVFRDYSQRVEQMMVVGGGAKSKMWQKILSDVFNVAISFARYHR